MMNMNLSPYYIEDMNALSEFNVGIPIHENIVWRPNEVENINNELCMSMQWKALDPELFCELSSDEEIE